MNTFRSLASLCSWRRQVAVFLAVGLVSALFAFHHPQPVAAKPSRYAADPLGLIADYDKMSFYSTHPDSYEVFICGPDRVDVTLDDAVAFLNSSGLGDFWSSISNGQYSVVFVAGTTISADTSIRCEQRVSANAASGQYRAGFIFVPERSWAAGKSPGWHFVRNDPENKAFYPTNDRWIISYLSQRLLDLPDQVLARTWSRWIGINFDLPISYTGVILETDPGYKADNLMDIQSGGNSSPGLTVGTIAVNRYALGWIRPEQVHVYQGGAQRLTLAAGWVNDTQMLVIPSDTQGYFMSLGVRVAKRHDVNIPKEGVEGYIVDQRTTACDERAQSDGVCHGFLRRQIPYPHDTETVPHPDPILSDYVTVLAYPTKHVLSPGEGMEWNGVTVTVLERRGDSYVVEISDGTATPVVEEGGSGRFADDDGNTHEADIERIAELGITVGCSTIPDPLYCPDRPVSRAEMAAFVARALQTPTPNPTTSSFADVNVGVWYAKYVHAIARLGIDTGDGDQWRPGDALTRLEMAQWLTAAYPHINPASQPDGKFGDVARVDWPTVEGLYEAGVTYGCSTQPLLYCPDQPVSRAQMASFIIRSLP